MAPLRFLCLAGAIFFASTQATPYNRHPSPDSNCIDVTIPISFTAEAIKVLFSPFENGYQATSFISQATSRNANGDLSSLLGSKYNVTETFPIPFTYCKSLKPGPKSDIVQVLSHGLGFDRSYWNFGNSTYNYISAANSAGFTTLSYDRLGTGASPKADPYSIVQAPVELAILTKITELLRSGNLHRKIPKPKKVVHVGHSYGSSLSNALVATRPELSDGLVTTGYSHNGSFFRDFLINTGFHLARDNSPRFKGYSTGYVTWPDKYSNEYSFFHYPAFSSSVVTTAEATKWPLTVAEFFTITAIPAAAPNYTAPVLMVTASHDSIFCGGNCTGIVDGPDSVSKSLFPKSKSWETYMQPETGHGMNLHFNATGWYGVVNEWIGREVV